MCIRDSGNAGDVAGDQRHAQITDEGVGQVAHFRLGIRDVYKRQNPG